MSELKAEMCYVYPAWFPAFSDMGILYPDYDQAVKAAILCILTKYGIPRMTEENMHVYDLEVNDIIDTGYQYSQFHQHLFLINRHQDWYRYLNAVGTHLYVEWGAIYNVDPDY